MASARTQCPECHGAHIVELNAILYAPNVDFFRCADCSYMWHVQKGKDGPASRSLLGSASVTPHRAAS